MNMSEYLTFGCSSIWIHITSSSNSSHPGSCHSNGDCRFSHDFSREDLQLLFEYFSFTEGRQQRAAAARAAAVPDAPAPGLQPPPLSQACFSSQGDTYIPPLQVGGGAEVEEI
eukprot:1152371-Pelagomonas_calceolata.AAC.2